MFLTVLTMSLSLPALAQERGGHDDPEYLRYLDTLDEIDDLIGRGNVKPQIDLGVAGIRLPDADLHDPDIATVWCEKTVEAGSTRTEHWFLADTTFLSDISDEYEMTLLDPTVVKAADVIPFLHGTWFVDPYVPVDHTYNDEIPSPSGNLGYAGVQITRHTFILEQGGIQVGAMLREAHWTAGGAFDQYVEHWIYFNTFQKLEIAGDKISVVSGPVQFATTAQFANHYAGVPIKAYAKPSFDLTLDGSAF